MRSDWTVRVIGVKETLNGDVWLVCKLVNLQFTPPPSDSRMRGEMVPGCDGELVSHGEFAGHVADGCVMCLHHISVLDAFDVVWIGGKPICPNCDERYYEDLTEEELSNAKNIH